MQHNITYVVYIATLRTDAIASRTTSPRGEKAPKFLVVRPLIKIFQKNQGTPDFPQNFAMKIFSEISRYTLNVT